MKATWHWYRFEYASRGSIHCHGVAKLEDDPGLVELTSIALKGYLASQKLKSESVAFQEREELNEIIVVGKQAEKQVCDYVDKLLCTCNPMEGENWIKPQVHPCMCWATFLRSDAAVSVPNHLRELETIENALSIERGTNSQDSDSEDDSEVVNDETSNYREEWMFLADHFSNQPQEDNLSGSENRTYWLDQCSQYNSLSRLEMPSWINSKKATLRIPGQLNDEDTELQNVLKLNAQQRSAFEIIRSYINSNSQLLMIIFGKAGCGKSFLIHRLRHLLGDQLIVSSLFGLAAYSVGGKTLHHLLRLPIKGKYNSELEGSSLIQLQES